MTRYFFDLTGAVWHLRRIQRFSGIQRTVVMLIDRAAAKLGAENVWIAYFDRRSGNFRTFPLTALAEGELIDADALRARLGFGRRQAGLHPALRKYSERPAKLWFHRKVLQLNALLGRDGPFRHRNTTLAEWRAYHGAAKNDNNVLQTTDFDRQARPGDKLVLLDGSWTVPKSEAAFRKAKADGLEVWTMIHDLIPIMAPEFSTDLSSLTFHDWMLKTANFTTVYLANSEATKRDLVPFLQTYGIDRQVLVLPLAQAALPSAPSEPALGPLLAQVNAEAYPRLCDGVGIDDRMRALMAQPFVLCVGTIEVRKNVWRTALAWDRMRAMSGIDLPKLVLAGRDGWMKSDFDNLMRATGNIGGWIEIFEGPSDTELAFLYRNCLFHLMPSLYEGWGLPVGEALSYGKTSVISRVTSLPEVGGDMVEYCDALSIDSIVEACLRLIRDPRHRQMLEARIAATRLRSWDDVGADLVQIIADGQNQP